LIKYLKHPQINKLQWDECISNSPNGLIYAYSWYLDIVCPNWEALVEDDYISVMPLPLGQKYGFTYAYPPPFTQQLGVFSLNEISEEKTMKFLSAIPSHYKYIEMKLNEKNIVSGKDFEVKNHATYILDLNRPYTEVYANYSSQTKRNLKKTQASSLTIVQSARPEKIIKLFRENRGLEHELSAAYYIILEQLIEVLLSKGLVMPMGVNDRTNKLCAGAFFIKCKDRHIFLFSGANETAYDTHAMTLLINSYLEEHSETPILFDFEGSMDADLARFYSGFGSAKSEFPVIRRNTLPAPVKWIKDMQFKRRSVIN
jgi:hypothetical protein